MSRPLRCPWCSKGHLHAVRGDAYQIECTFCGARGPVHEERWQAVAEWNRIASLVMGADDGKRQS